MAGIMYQRKWSVVSFLNISDISVVPHMLVSCYNPGMVTGGRHALVQATLLTNCIFRDTI